MTRIRNNLTEYNERRSEARREREAQAAQEAAEVLASDRAHARKIWEELQEDADSYDGPEIAMFSFGYGEVWLDGDVTSAGLRFNVGGE